MTKSIVKTFLVLTLLLLSTPSTFAQLTRLKTSYSALTANMAAYWLAKDIKIFEKHGLDVDVVLIESGETDTIAIFLGVQPQLAPLDHVRHRQPSSWWSRCLNLQ
jgi:ABC-type nitrate/sulfonate/bicarbonate transport system substrate-binding protein